MCQYRSRSSVVDSAFVPNRPIVGLDTMLLFPKAREGESAGDLNRRRGSACLLAAVIATPMSIWLFSNLENIWPQIMPLEGSAFLAGATALGTALAILPLIAGLGFLLAIWFGVESVFQARQHPTPVIDKLIVGAGLLVWFAPVIAALASAGRALATGRIHFVRPPRDYFLATDPIAYWQGVGFWIIMAGLFGFLAWRYWRGKLLARA